MKTLNQKIVPVSGMIELESGEYVTHRLLSLRIALNLAVVTHYARREGSTLILVHR